MDKSGNQSPSKPDVLAGLESLNTPSTPAQNSNPQSNPQPVKPIIQRRPTKPWKVRALTVAITVLVLGVLGASTLKLSQKVRNTASLDNSSAYKPIANPVLGDITDKATQSLNGDKVTINGDLVVQGKLVLSAEAIDNLGGLVGNKVNLQQTLGTTQAGNIAVSGTIVASNFQGNGANLSNLNASSLATGTISNDRLDSSVTRLGQSIPLSALQPTILSSINGVTNNGGNVDIVGGTGLAVTTDLTNKVITISSVASGDITSVTAGTGLTGGGTSGDVTLDVDTGVVTIQGNTFNGASQLVKLNGASELPVASAINLTNLNASNVAAGTLSDARLSANVTLQGNTFNLPSKLVQLDSSGFLPTLNGSALTNLNASNVSAGTLSDARLSANVALLNANQIFSGNTTFSQPLSVNVIQPSATMTIGATNQSLTLQGDLTSKFTVTGSGNTASFGFTGTPTGTVNYTLDASTTPGNYELCTTVGNCAGSGSGVTSTGGNTNKLAKFTGAQAVGDSTISDDGSLVTVGATGLYKASADSTTAFRVQNAAGSTNVFTVDSTNTRVAIGQTSASYPLDVFGDINSTTALRVGGNLVCDSTGCAAGSGSGFYIQNGTSLQTAANLNIESSSTSQPTAVVKAKTGQTADLFQAKDSSGTVIAKIDVNGNIDVSGQFQVNGSQISSSDLSNNSNLAKLNGSQTFSGNNTLTGTALLQNATNSTTAFQIQNAAGSSNLLIADTSNSRIAIGQATAGYTLDVNGDINITSGSAYRINGVAICGPTATCAPSSGSGSYIQNSAALQTAANINIQSASSSSIVAILKGANSQTADILQARDSNDNIIAKITSAGAIYQGANQVCDASNNCNYVTTSAGAGNYIQNSTTQQTANFNIKSAAAGSVGAVIQGATSQTADLLQIKDGSANNVASIGAGGDALFKASTSSSTAFQIQNAGGSTILGLDTNVAASSSWTATSSISVVRYDGGYTSYNNRLYIFGGYNGSSLLSDVQYVTTNPDGTLGSWTATTSMSGVRSSASAVAYNGYMYLLGGQTTTAVSSAQTLVQYAVINSDGTLGSWSSTTSLGTARFSSSAFVYNGYIYIMGGRNSSGTRLNDVQYAPINSNGTLGSWSSTSSFTTARNLAAATVYNGYAYLTAGFDGSNYLSDIQYAAINSNGTLGSWATTTSSSFTRAGHLAGVSGGNLYLIGGYYPGGTASTDVRYAPINSNGTVGAWSNGTSLSIGKASLAGYLNNGFAYVVGGITGSSTVTATAHFVSLGGTSSKLTVNAAQVNSSTALYQNSSDSTTAFQIQNAAGTSNLFVADTTNTRIGIGKSAPSYTLDVAGDINSTTALRVGGTSVCTSSGCTAASGSTNYIQNGTTQQTANFNIKSAAAGSVGAIIQGATSQTADILQAKNGSAVTLLSVGSTGNLYVKSTAGGSNLLQVVDNAGANLLNLSGSSSGPSWTNTTALTTARSSAGFDSYNGYAYITGGQGSSSVLSDVQYAPIGSDGTLGSWSATTTLPGLRKEHVTFTYNGYIYTLGGSDGSSFFNDVLYSSINANGTINSWNTTTALPVSMSNFRAAAYNGYVYLTGGYGSVSGNRNSVYYSKIASNGTLGSWSTGTSFSTARNDQITVAYNGYLYIMGGINVNTPLSDIQYAQILGDGSISAWTTASTTLPSARWGSQGLVVNGTIRITGGDNYSTLTNNYYQAALNSNGTVGTFTQLASFANARWRHAIFSSGNTVIIVGGSGVTGYVPAAPYYADAQYVPLTGANQFSISASLNTTGAALFRNDYNSTTAFQVQNAAATSIFQVDTANSRVGISNASPGNLLSVGALTTADSSGQLAVGTAGTGNKGIIIQAVSGQTADLLQAQDSTGAVLAKIDSVGNLTVKNINFSGHIIGAGSVPSITADQGAGTSPIISVIGTDTAGLVTITTDIDPTGAISEIAHVHFVSPYATNPYITLSPANDAAAALTGSFAVYAQADQNSIIVFSGNTALSPSTQYKWYYHVIQ